MKAILLSVFCTFALNVQSVEVKKDTIDKYVIDKQVIERFDGTQLEGKTISKYIIAYKDAGKAVEKMHIILTGNESFPLVNGSIFQTKFEGLVIVDGKEMKNYNINPKEIASVKVHKAGSKVAESYGEKGQKGIIMITTKANMTSGNIYFINGKRVEKSEVDKLSPDRIALMKIDKKDGNSVIEITTKK